MTSEKIEDGYLDVLLRKVERGCDAKTSNTLRAHIAAVTAERDNWKRMHESNVTAAAGLAVEFNHAGVGTAQDGVVTRARVLLDERDALRERVKVLEGEVTAAVDGRRGRQQRAKTLTSDLAAIRQRAEAIQRPGVAASVAGTTTGAAQDVARYIAGDDAPAPGAMVCGACDKAVGEHKEDGTAENCEEHRAPSEMDGLRGEMAEDAEFDRMANPGLSPEPTTAEAFAKLRAEHAAWTDDAKRVLPLHSLLERRMGAQDAALRHVQRWLNHETTALVPESLKRDVATALTGAPGVWTLEEVRSAVRPVLDQILQDWLDGNHEDATDVRRNMERVEHNLTALRR